MKFFDKTLWFNTNNRREIIHVSRQIQDVVDESRITEGLCYVGSMHTTAAVLVNDNESGLHSDLFDLLEKIAPYSVRGYKHNRTGEDNAEAHLRAMFLHPQIILPVSNGQLVLGTWQRIFYLELDGKRRKRLFVKVIGE